MIKHIGKHGDRKVAIVFREVPGEEHMTLVGRGVAPDERRPSPDQATTHGLSLHG